MTEQDFLELIAIDENTNRLKHRENSQLEFKQILIRQILHYMPKHWQLFQIIKEALLYLVLRISQGKQ